jgi:hypothetical protein
MATKKLMIWKNPFFKNISEQGGAMDEAIEEHDKKTNIVILTDTQKYGRAWGYTTPLKMLELVKTNKGLYEVIIDYPYKVYFDIDSKKGSCRLDEIKQTIYKYFPNAEMAISGSITPEKTSYHCICNNYTIHNLQERDYVKQVVKHINETENDSFDWKVYTKNRNMKCINQSKRDGRVQEIIEDDDYRHHLITCFINDYSLPFPEINEEIEEGIMISQSKGLFDISSLPKLILREPTDFDFFSCKPIDLLPLFPISINHNHQYTHLIARYCYYKNISIEHFLSWISKKHNTLTDDIIRKWKRHWGRLHKFPNPSDSKIIAVLSYYYPHIRHDKSYKEFANTFILPAEEIKYIDTITEEDFLTPSKYLLFNVGMGGGKTHQTIDYLNKFSKINKDERGFIWLCPNKALANNTLNRIQENNIPVSYYLDFTTKQKENGDLNKEPNLIIVLNSIHYLQKKTYSDALATGSPRVVVIDEIETLIDKFLGDFMKKKVEIWNVFKHILLNADKVIFLDAFITTKTTDFIKNLEGTNCGSPCIYQRINEPSTRTVEIIKTKELMINDIIVNLKKDKKCFIFWPYKKESFKNISMEMLSNMIQKETCKKGIFYNADVDDKIKGGLKDVNKSWVNYDFVITNNIITCGVNYERKDFDCAYIFVAGHNSPRDMAQVSYRTRFLSSEIIKFCYLGSMMQPTTHKIDTFVINCPIYTKLIKSILVEKNSPLQKTLQLFLNKARYRFEINTEVLSADLKKYIKELVLNCEVGFSYENVDDIDSQYAKIIEQNCFAQTATMIEKVMLQKYFFKKSFKDSAEKIYLKSLKNELPIVEPIVEHAWNEQLSFFFCRTYELLNKPDNIFNSIRELNGNEGIFPKKIKKTKLNEPILDEIFKQFNFKFITRNSSTEKILKEVFNTYFSKRIVETQYKKGTNIEYKVDHEYYNELYNFAKDYLKYEVYKPTLDCQDNYTIDLDSQFPSQQQQQPEYLDSQLLKQQEESENDILIKSFEENKRCKMCRRKKKDCSCAKITDYFYKK